MGSRVLVAGLTAVVLTGCSGGGDDPAPKAKSTPDPVEAALDEASAKPEAAGDEDALYELLSDRATMLERGEGRAFSLTSKGAQRARDRQAARRAKRIALERVSFTPDDLTTAGRRATVTGTFAYRVRGMKRPFRTPRRVQAIKTSDGWRVTEDRPRREPLPWEIAPFRAFRTRHVVLLAPHGMDVGPLRSGLEDAYREIR